MEEMEQPKQESLGSVNEQFGKFKDAETLLKAYNNLEAEFTKKSQKLASLEQEKENTQLALEKENSIDKKVEEFVTKFEIAKPFSSALKETLAKEEGAVLEEEAVRLLAKNYKRAEDYIKDDEFLNNYVYSNKEIKDKIVKDYLSNITQDSPIKMESNASILLSKPNVPSTVAEAGRLAKSIIKQK